MERRSSDVLEGFTVWISNDVERLEMMLSGYQRGEYSYM
jgi:hypothetical protein